MTSDMVNNMALENYCRKEEKNGSIIYRYIFEHFNPKASIALNPMFPFCGATHCTELIYLFNVNIFVVPFRRNRNDYKVIELTTKLWTNFAKFGNPNYCNIPSSITKVDLQISKLCQNLLHKAVIKNKYLWNKNKKIKKILDNKYDKSNFLDKSLNGLYWPSIDANNLQIHLAILAEPKIKKKLASSRIEILAPLFDFSAKTT